MHATNNIPESTNNVVETIQYCLQIHVWHMRVLHMLVYTTDILCYWDDTIDNKFSRREDILSCGQSK